MTVTVRRLVPGPESEDMVEDTAQWLVDSFADDPIMLPCLGGQAHLSICLWRSFLKAGLVGGEVHVASIDSDTRTDGVAIWFAPNTDLGETPDQEAVWYEEYGKHMNADATVFWNTSYEEACNQVLDRVLDKEARSKMWHLQILGTRPSAQRRGIARALIEYMNDRTRDTGIRLETCTALNVKIYTRLGFTNEGGTALLQSPHGDTVMRCMFKWPCSGNGN
ncbi:hypothetical protein EXIGLDRAFT_726167 [Exidia glandulosa HHB12029]|uniref:N-acetyltransferase domain-containing protein n=1 Tax=Exidia glandulosa HHB12029 TaxID=1314781 RepID=A0A165DUT0_EXIGL|nr:hypothetical protein EXIGLDRAFT_726167 [Exidia glandulosa HHB12029]